MIKVETEMTKEKFKARNGDTLEDLNEQFARADSLVTVLRFDLEREMATLLPLKERLESAISLKINLATRLNVWWREWKRSEPK